MSNLYQMMNGVNPATFLILPMLGKHPDEYPRFRDCFISDDESTIIILTRVGGGNRNQGYGEEEMCKSPHFVKTYDAEWDNSYGYYEFSVPEEWKEDFGRLMKGEPISEKYLDQMCKVYPKLESKFREDFGHKEEEGKQ